MKKIKIIFFSLIILIGIFFRFYNLNWGAPFYFHPDERNIIYSILQLSFSNLNPHFFAYGSVPIYIIFFIDLLINKLKLPIDFNLVVLTGRFLSFLLSSLILVLIFKVAKKIKNTRAALITTIFASLSVGFIQFSHFLTFETWLSFFYLLFLYLSLKQFEKNSFKNLVLTSVIFGLTVGIKIVAIPLSIIFIFVLLIKNFKNKIRFILYSLTFIFISLLVFLITNPFLILDTNSFMNSMHYESSVALGTIPVFYTQEFFNTTPLIFQLFHVFPFLLNPILTLIFIFSFLYLIIKILKGRNIKYLILLLFLLITIFSSDVFFVKWTRYAFLALPFIYILIGIFIEKVYVLSLKKNTLKIASLSTILLLFLISFIFSFSYFKTVYLNFDTRIQAANFLSLNANSNTKILSETYDLGIIPFNNYFSNITLLNFYNLETDNNLQHELPILVKNSNYVVLPSQRIIKTRLNNAKLFPLGNIFYTNLVNGSLGYKLIYKTPCNIFCKITYLGNPVFSYEETASVFDRPTVFIFKKIKEYKIEYYQSILEQ